MGVTEQSLTHKPPPKKEACLGDPRSRRGAILWRGEDCLYGGKPGWRALHATGWAGERGDVVCGCLLLMPRDQQCESAGGPLCERPAPAPGHPTADRASGSEWDAAL